MKTKLIIISILISSYALAQKNAFVSRVKDGDTFTAVWDGKEYTCRFSNLDAPELKQNFGRNSKDSLSKLLLGKRVSLDSIKQDLYNRVLVNVRMGYVRLDSLLIRNGWAWHYIQYSKDPVLHLAMQEAAHNGIGLWHCGIYKVCPPWLYRKYDYRNQLKYCKGCKNN